MAEFDDEIEYLEEDAEIVQQCVKTLEAPKSQAREAPRGQARRSLLVPRASPRPVERRKRKKEEDDSDYDPTEDIEELEEINKRKMQQQKKTKSIHVLPTNNVTKTVRYYHHVVSKEQYASRKKLNIRIPDYEDPLCLPVRAIKTNESDKKKLSNWNNVCLEHFKYCDEILKPERSETKKSVRTAIFKNVVNTHTSAVETTIWSKTTVENTEGDKKSEIFQCVLPRYKEKKVLNNYILANRRKWSPGQKTEAILSKENHKDGEALVVYKPQEALSAIYGLIDKRKKESQSESADEDSKMYLKELACCRVCAPCFQGSSRGAKKLKNKALVCPICARTYVSIYNLLSHLKTHSTNDIRRYRKIISSILANMVGYHYKCRICHQTCADIKSLRQHTLKHQCKDIFKCEVGNHVINGKK